jgi:soluble lytic murein transglycosylase-like protein
MQLLPETARLHRVSNVYDPEENIDAGVRHLKLLLDRYRR